MTRADLIWTQLHLPRPLDDERVTVLLSTLAADRQAPLLAFEIRADEHGLVYLMGCPPEAVRRLHRMVTDYLPGTVLTAAPPRRLVGAVGRLDVAPRGLPLRTEHPEAITRAVLSALGTPLQRTEVLVVQLLLGPRLDPRLVENRPSAPTTHWWQVLAGPLPPATGDERRLLKNRAEQPGFGATLRVGVSAATPERRRHLMLPLQSAIATAKGAGTRLSFLHETPGHLGAARAPFFWPLSLSVPELIGPLAWPLGDGELPGLPPLHPKPLRANRKVHSGERVFAVADTPGDERRLGIAPADSLLHAVAYGPSGSGKSTAMLHLICADIRAGRPVAVLDPKRQLIDDVLARIPTERVDDVVLLDVADPQTVGFNPLDVAGRDPDVVVDGVMAVFEHLFAEGWGPRTSDILSAAMRTLTHTATSDRAPTLLDIPRLLTDPEFRRARLRQVAGDEGLVGFWTWFEAQAPAAQAAAIAPPLNKLRQLLLRPTLVRLLGQPSTAFRLRDLWRSNKIVLVPLNEGLIGSGTAELLGSLIVADLFQAIQERAATPHLETRPGMVYLDEAPRFLHLPTSVEDALAISRGLGVGWFLAAQFRGQFTPSLRTAIDVNARSKLVFATEHEDAAFLARSSSQLDPEDFVALDRFQAYANLVADGHPRGWALVRTLPPPEQCSDPHAVAARSRQLYGIQVPPPPVDGPDEPPTPPSTNRVRRQP